MKIFLAILLFVAFVFAFALCRVAAITDEQLNEYHKKKREKENE